MNRRELLENAKAYRCPDCDCRAEIVTIRGPVVEAIVHHDNDCCRLVNLSSPIPTNE